MFYAALLLPGPLLSAHAADQLTGQQMRCWKRSFNTHSSLVASDDSDDRSRSAHLFAEYTYVSLLPPTAPVDGSISLFSLTPNPTPIFLTRYTTLTRLLSSPGHPHWLASCDYTNSHFDLHR